MSTDLSTLEYRCSSILNNFIQFIFILEMHNSIFRNPRSLLDLREILFFIAVGAYLL